jgi:hypothetical protein
MSFYLKVPRLQIVLFLMFINCMQKYVCLNFHLNQRNEKLLQTNIPNNYHGSFKNHVLNFKNSITRLHLLNELPN